MASQNILDKIIEVKRREVEGLKSKVPLSELEGCLDKQSPPLNFGGALWGPNVRLITEVKKASPSRGVLRQNFDPLAIASEYLDNGAAAISVLTEVDHFQGSLDYLAQVQGVAYTKGIPVLRKDFIFDEYQVIEARAYGADAILLIVAAITPQCLKNLLSLSQSLWMQCLVEVHNEEELATALNVGAEVIGINNRDLTTFHTDLAVTQRLAPTVPKGKIIVSESGIHTREHMRELKQYGVHAALVGEALITATDIGAKIRELA